MRSNQINIHDVARGKWKSILPALGVSMTHLTGKHGPCPMCGGKDRFRFDDRGGDGTYFCNQCGAGRGVDLVMGVLKIDFMAARKLILDESGHAPVEVARASRPDGEAATKIVDRIWCAAHPLNGIDAASKYLEQRGLALTVWPKLLRFHPRMSYVHDDKTVTYHPALVARFVSPDATSSTVQMIYLTDDGHKVDLPIVKKFAPVKVPMGGTVRLCPSAETMGIAEGIETALAAMILNGVPVWATLTAGAMVKWEPPQTARNIIVYADADSSFTGQASAFALAHRLKVEGYNVDVHVPHEIDVDWNDVLLAERAA